MVIKVRMFADDYSGVALWREHGGDGRLPPIPDDLQADLDAWIDNWELLHGSKSWPANAMFDHDIRGWDIAQRLQRAFGPDYYVKFEFETDEARATVATDTPPPVGARPPRPRARWGWVAGRERGN
ncbi:hypothetical protein [Nocardioides bigeumensis]|uniref:DUF3303 domain-containing protein n=1 Tax=Nocardioides bigeumensis TaxID=433657 RepID=A0ABP5J854_9ACTN